MRIEEIPNISDHAVAGLRALGYDPTYLMFAAQIARPELASFLRSEIDPLIEGLADSVPQFSAEEVNRLMQLECPMGANVDNPVPMTAVPLMATPCTSGSINLIAQMTPIRNQQSRGTCVAHAVVAAYEHYLNINGVSQPDMSEQYLYYNCKRNDGIPNAEGTWIRIAAPLLQRDGVCPESVWPYNPTPILGNEGQGPPPPGAIVSALGFRSPNSRSIAPTSIQDIKNELCAGRAVPFSIPVFNSWYQNLYVRQTGELGMPIPGEVRVGGHAMCFVGYEDLPGQLALGEGRFYLRNSWGPGWAAGSRLGSGYGTIPYAYIAKFGSEAYCIS